MVFLLYAPQGVEFVLIHVAPRVAPSYATRFATCLMIKSVIQKREVLSESPASAGRYRLRQVVYLSKHAFHFFPARAIRLAVREEAASCVQMKQRPSELVRG